MFVASVKRNFRETRLWKFFKASEYCYFAPKLYRSYFKCPVCPCDWAVYRPSLCPVHLENYQMKPFLYAHQLTAHIFGTIVLLRKIFWSRPNPSPWIGQSTISQQLAKSFDRKCDFHRTVQVDTAAYGIIHSIASEMGLSSLYMHQLMSVPPTSYFFQWSHTHLPLNFWIEFLASILSFSILVCSRAVFPTVYEAPLLRVQSLAPTPPRSGDTPPSLKACWAFHALPHCQDFFTRSFHHNLHHTFFTVAKPL